MCVCVYVCVCVCVYVCVCVCIDRHLQRTRPPYAGTTAGAAHSRAQISQTPVFCIYCTYIYHIHTRKFMYSITLAAATFLHIYVQPITSQRTHANRHTPKTTYAHSLTHKHAHTHAHSHQKRHLRSQYFHPTYCVVPPFFSRFFWTKE